MAKKTTRAKAKPKVKPQPTKTKSMKAKSGTKVSRPGMKTRKVASGKAPFDQDHRELKGQRGGQPGSLEEETLDADAPYNKTYGRAGKK